MNGTRKVPHKATEKTIKVRLTVADQKALDAIIASGWATNTTTAVRYALKLASERVLTGAAA